MAAGEQGTGEALVLALTTEASLERAERLARSLVERGLVACVTLAPVLSIYRWQGVTTRGDEVQLLLKTQAPRLEALYQAVMALHSYDTPEWITVAAETRGGYGQWCAEQLGDSPLRPGDAPPAPSGTPGDGDPAG
jgi:periplasmic divalent cation tolerance protein